MKLKPWQGKSVFIWYVDCCERGNVQAIITKARASKIDSVIVKAHDGTSWWTQFNPQLVERLHAAGIAVGAWGYCYGHNPAEEAALAVKALELGADFYVADVEVEFESLPASVAHQLMNAIRIGAKGKPVGFTSFGLPNYHAKFPWLVFAAYSDFVLPQVYWGDFGMNPTAALLDSLQQCKPFHIPVVPLGQAYGNVTPVQMGNFVVMSRGCDGVSWWSWQHATDPMWAAIAENNVAVPQAVQPTKTSAVQSGPTEQVAQEVISNLEKSVSLLKGAQSK